MRVELGALAEAGTVAEDGSWLVELPPREACAEETLRVSDERQALERSCAIGEVWLCSGQSNMTWPVGLCEETEAKETLRDPPKRVSVLDIPRIPAPIPVSDVLSSWRPLTSANLPFQSAVALHFGAALAKSLDLPVGIIHASEGSTRIVSWMEQRSIARLLPDVAPSVTDHREAARRWAEFSHFINNGRWDRLYQNLARLELTSFKNLPRPTNPLIDQPSLYYNGMIAPLGQVALAGVLWYQGESDAAEPSRYPALFGALSTSWREQFRRADLPFVLCQLAGYGLPGEHRDWPGLRAAQEDCCRQPEVFMASAIDLGDQGDIHPGRKREVGRRAAAVALKHVYGYRDYPSHPTVRGVRREQGGLRVSFDDGGSPLRLRDHDTAARGFSLRHGTEAWRPAAGTLDRDGVRIPLPDGCGEPIALKYAWEAFPGDANLENHAGFPALPFARSLE